MDCIQFKINGKLFQFKGVAVTGDPSIYNILRSLNKGEYELQLRELRDSLRYSGANLVENSINNFTEAGDALVGNISLKELRTVKLKFGNFSHESLDKILTLMNSAYRIDKSNIRVINSTDPNPIIYLGAKRNLITITPETSDADLASALAYTYVDSMLREHTSELTKEFNKLREQLEDSDLKRELDLLPDNINKNKRLLYYLSQSDSFPEVILQKIEQAYKKVKILNNLDNVITLNDLSSVIKINGEDRATVGNATFKVKTLLEFKDEYSKAYSNKGTEVTLHTDEDLFKKMGVETYIENSLPFNVYQRDFLYNSPKEYKELIKEIYKAENDYPDKYFNESGTLSVTSVITSSLIEVSELKGVDLSKSFTINPKATVLFEPDLVALSKRKIVFFDSRDNMAKDVQRLKVTSKDTNSNKNYAYVNLANLKSKKSITTSSKLAIPSEAVSSLSDKEKLDLLEHISNNSNVSVLNLDGDDKVLVHIADSLGFSINIYSDNWKTESGINDKISYINQFDNIKLQKITFTPNTPVFKFYKTTSSHGYSFSGNNVTDEIQKLQAKNDKLELTDLVKSGHIKTLVVKLNSNNKPLLEQPLNKKFILSELDGENRFPISITNKYVLPVKDLNSTDNIGNVVYAVVNGKGTTLVQIGDLYYNIDNGDLVNDVKNPSFLYKSTNRIIGETSYFRVSNGVFTVGQGVDKTIQALENFHKEDLTKLSRKSGYSYSFLVSKIFDTVDSYNNTNIIDFNVEADIGNEAAIGETDSLDVNSLAYFIAKDLGIEVEIVKKSEYGNDVKAYVKDGKIFLVDGAFTDDSLLHELSHILLANLKSTNFVAYQNLLDLVDTKMIETFKEKYPNLSQNDLLEEILVHQFSNYYSKELIKNKDLINEMNKQD